MIEAVFLDLYETLITEWENEKKKAVYSTDRLGINSEVFNEKWRLMKKEQSIGVIPNYSSALKHILNELQVTIDPHLIDFLEEERIEGKSLCFSNIDGEIIDALEAIKGSGVKLGLISNCAPEDVMAWGTCALAPYFDETIFSYEVGVAKPDSKIYHLACDRLAVDPEHCIFVGDGGSNELYGAAQVGMTAYQATWFQPSWKSEKIKHDLKLETPSEIVDVISRSK